MEKQITIPLTVTLRAPTYEKLTRDLRDANPADVLGSYAQQHLENWANGAVVVKADDVRSIEESIGKPVTNAKDVVAAAQRGVGIEAGANVFQFPMDPSFVAALRDRAEEAGRTVEEIVADMVDIALENGWLYAIEYRGPRRTFSDKQEAFFQKLAGGKKDFSLDDLEEGVRKLMKDARSGQKELAGATK